MSRPFFSNLLVVGCFESLRNSLFAMEEVLEKGSRRNGIATKKANLKPATTQQQQQQQRPRDTHPLHRYSFIFISHLLLSSTMASGNPITNMIASLSETYAYREEAMRLRVAE